MDNNQYFKDAIKNRDRHPAVIAFYQQYIDGQLTTHREQSDAYERACAIELSDLLEDSNTVRARIG